MKVLGIESSCDETACAIVEDGRKILSNVVATQIPFHQIYKGVVPEIASRKHAEWILPVVRQSLEEAHLNLDEVDAIAATNRPGLMGALLVGLTFGKTLAWAFGKPFIAVNHMLGHMYAAHLENDIPYPYIGLLVSGGHSIISKVNGFDDLEILGTTIDDSVGEAFDKVAKYYDLGYPGGVIIDRLSKNGNPDAFSFPLPKLDKGEHRYDVSFSGLKTAVIHQADMFLNSGFEKSVENIAASFQETACRTLVSRLLRAVGRELTKLHEEITEGTAQEVFEDYSSRQKILGEFAVFISGNKNVKISEESSDKIREARYDDKQDFRG